MSLSEVVFNHLLQRLSVHPSVVSFFLSPVFGLVALVLLSDCSAGSTAGAVSFLPDDAEIACRAILPQCFRRSDWAHLCARDPSVATGHPEACRAAGFEPDQPLQGR